MLHNRADFLLVISWIWLIRVFPISKDKTLHIGAFFVFVKTIFKF